MLKSALGIEFVDRIEPFTKPVNYYEFRSFSPTGQVPALIHTAAQQERTVWDSLGIVLYLADRHRGVWPTDEAACAFAQCAVSEMHGGFAALRNQCTMNVGVRVKMGPHDAALTRDVARVRELFEQGLREFGGPWLAGAQFSALDAFFAPVAFRIRTFRLDVGAGQEWVDHILAHPAMLEWEAAALAENWREASHEEELAAAGSVTADYRTG